MKLFTLLIFLISTAAFAGNGSGNVSNVISVTGGQSTASLTPPVMATLPIPSTATTFSLYCGDVNTTATLNNYYPCYKNGVAFHTGLNSNKVAHCYNITATVNTTSTNWYQFVSATASFAFNASSLTGAIYQGGASGRMVMEAGTGAAAFFGTAAGTYDFGDGSTDTWVGFQPNNAQQYVIHLDCYQ